MDEMEAENSSNDEVDANLKTYPIRKRIFSEVEADSSDEGELSYVVEEETDEEIVEDDAFFYPDQVGPVDHVDGATPVPQYSSEEEDHEDDKEENYESDDLEPETSDDENEDPVDEDIFHELFNTEWSWHYVLPPTNFTGPQPGPVNIPNTINEESTPLDFLNLFIGEDVYARLCLLTNLKADQVNRKKPANYYARLFQDNPVDTQEMRAFIAICIMMEFGCYKPCYESYWYGRNKNFVTYTPGFRDVMDRDRFLSIWTFLKIVNEQDPNLDKTDKIYKVQPMLNILLPRFRYYYNSRQELSLDEGMIPAKNRLAIKQYIKDKPTKWGIKSFLLCESETGYIINAEIYTGKADVVDVNAGLGATGNVVCRLLRDAGVDQMHHIIFVDRCYTSCKLFFYLYYVMRTHAVGTVLTNRKGFPRSLIQNKKDMVRGDIKYQSQNNLQAIVWQDRKPIYFLSTFHDPEDVRQTNRRTKKGTLIEINIPALVVDYNSYMGGCDKNDQLTRLEKIRKHYRWPRRLIVKFFVWTCYNAYIIMSHYSPHDEINKRTRTFKMFLNDLCIEMIGEYRGKIKRRESRVNADDELRLKNVGIHFPEVPPDATGDNTCAVCRKKHQVFKRTHRRTAYKNMPKKVKSKFRCSDCQQFLCLKKGSTCWHDWHTKKNYWS